MAYTTISKSSEHFNTKLYTGSNYSNAQTGVGFQPDWIWFKRRDSAAQHSLIDSVRGVTKLLATDLTDAEATASDALTSFDSDGFTLGADSSNYINFNSATYASWNWKAGNSSGSANTDGSANNVKVSANTTSGFSIVQGDMNASGSWTFGHGLGVAPSVIILRGQNVTSHWFVYHKSLGAGNYIALNSTDASASNTTFMDNTAPTSSVFSMNAGTWSAGAGQKIIAYCFAEKTGFSKFGEYTGNGNSDGTFVHLGFKPAFVIIKSKGSGTHWRLADNKRDDVNPSTKQLFSNNNAAEATDSNYAIDFVSNGFKHRNTNSDLNQNAVNYIYMAFAEAPLVGSNNVPCTAR